MEALDQILIEQRMLSPDDHPLIEQVVRHLLEKHDDPRKCLTVFDAELMVPLRDRLQLIGDPELLDSIANLDSRAPNGHAGRSRRHDRLGRCQPRRDDRSLRLDPPDRAIRSFPDPPASCPREGSARSISRGMKSWNATSPSRRSGRSTPRASGSANASCARRRSTATSNTPASSRSTRSVPIPMGGRITRCDSSRERRSRSPSSDSTRRAAGLDPAQWAIGLRQLLRRFIDVCDSIDYAHSRGVLHRDLKPSNILLGKFGETLIIDWGLAKIIGRSDVNVPDKAEAEAARPVSRRG